MRGLWGHFWVTLVLNFRNRQALVYGYVVPVFFLVAFGSIFRSESPVLLRELGQLLTISVLGGACFGMPTAMVAERERGVWRRYRMLPVRTGGLVISTMGARFVIVMTAAVMQVVLARVMYGMPWPVHMGGMVVAFCFVVFAFLGMGLVIAMVAEGVPAVQALGQAVFLPMIMIGGVGVPLWTLPEWARHVAGFLPGKYAVGVLQSCAMGEGLKGEGFDLGALLVIGVAGCAAGAKMFRWDMQEKVDWRGAWKWVAVAILAWMGVGIAAEVTGKAAEGIPGARAASTQVAGKEAWEGVTREQIEGITYDNLLSDDGTVTPVKGVEDLNEEGKLRAVEIRKQLAAWGPGREGSVERRVRNLLSVAGVVDLAKDPYEGVFAYLVFEKLKADVPKEELEKVLAWILLSEDDKEPVMEARAFGVETEAGVVKKGEVAEREWLYAKKLLGRLLGKLG